MKACDCDLALSRASYSSDDGIAVLIISVTRSGIFLRFATSAFLLITFVYSSFLRTVCQRSIRTFQRDGTLCTRCPRIASSHPATEG